MTNGSSIQIFPATRIHYPIIQEIAFKTWGPTYGEILTQAQTDFMLDWMYSDASLDQQINEKGCQFIIAESDGKPVGFSGFEPNYQGLPKMRIHKLYVFYEIHGKGIGNQLLNYISEIAVNHGNTILNLNVNRYNKAIGFYKKAGFEIIGEEDIDIGHGYLMEDYIMEKAIY